MSSKGINLLGDKKQISLTPAIKKLYTLRLIAVGLLFTVSAVSIMLFLLIALSPLPGLQKQEQEALRILSEHHPDMAKFYLVNERLKASNVILEKRRNFDKTFETVEKQMPSGLSITALTIRDKDMSITVTSGSLSSLDKFLNNLSVLVEESEDFSNATLTNFIVNQQQNTFSLTVSLVMI
jgi:Tfp pilus assembly protein PilN